MNIINGGYNAFFAGNVKDRRLSRQPLSVLCRNASFSEPKLACLLIYDWTFGESQ